MIVSDFNIESTPKKDVRRDESITIDAERIFNRFR